MVGDIKGNFIIPSYQRGYRWGRSEVRALLDDIMENGRNPYCLQPVVVRRTPQDTFEVIDGQQRLTTLWLVYKFIHETFPNQTEAAKFSIDYQSRPHSREFLENFDSDRSDDNIEYFHFVNAYATIRDYFSDEGHDLFDELPELYKRLRGYVSVLWYEVPDTEDPNALFQRLNIGKIPLTSSELVKALFMRGIGGDDKDKSATLQRQQEVALEWDRMESDLMNPSLWGFLTNASPQDYPTRIDLVLDLMAEKKPDEKEKYFTFFHFNRLVKEGKDLFREVWPQIVRTFMVMKEWHSDHTFYHKIGYLIASGAATLQEIYKASQDCLKSKFDSTLDRMIRDSLPKKPLDELAYDKDKDRKDIGRVLLLFNVLSVMAGDGGRRWFPFDTHRRGHWSLEHIHAQQSQGLNTNASRRQWLESHAAALDALALEGDRGRGAADARELARQARELTAMIDKDSGANVGQEFNRLQQAITQAFTRDDGVDYLHSLYNMALLTGEDNAALSNSVFDVKRSFVVEWDKQGRYIPFCTKMVFYKYYSPANTSLHFWGQEDRMAYRNALRDKLAPYLNEKDDQENGN